MAVLTLTNKEFDSFPEVLKEYARHTSMIKGNSEKTVCEYLLDLRTFFRYYKMKKSGADYSEKEFEEISITDITVEDVKRVTQSMILDYLIFAGFKKNNSTTTRNRKLSSLRSFFGYAYSKKHIIDFNPTGDVDSAKKAKTLPKYLTLEEALLLLETVKNDKESKTRIRDHSIISLFLNTGMRLSELIGLNIESFNASLTAVTVIGKGNKERIVYLNSSAKQAVLDYLRIRTDPKYIHTSDNAFFLSGRQQRISAKTVQWVVYKYLKMAGLEYKGLSVHKLRHTAATLMYQSGNVDIRVLKEILGHEQLNTTQIYTHVVSKSMEDAMSQNPLANKKK